MMGDPTRAISLLWQGLWLEYITLSWNVVGVLILIYAALKSGSVALAGFGLDSLVEIFAYMVVVWEVKTLRNTPCSVR